MGKGSHLGELEELILLTVGTQHEGAYGVSVMDTIKEESGRVLNVSAVHAVLKRLEEKGFVKSWMGGATNARGGRRKRLFSLTASGKNAIDESMNYRLSLYQKIPEVTYKFSY